jgi:hypothetical protein
MHGAVGERVRQHLGQCGAADHHQRLTEGLDQPLTGRVPQPGAVPPAQRPGGDPAAGLADGITKADFVKCRKRIGPDADSRTGRCVGALFDDADLVAAAL